MIGWTIAGIYAAAAFVCGIAGTRFAQNEFPDQHSGADMVMNGVLGLAVGALWPIALVGWLLVKLAGKTPAVRAAELDEREKRIAELERELGIR